MSEAKDAKFKVGDRVEVTADQGDLVKAGMQFVVTAVNGFNNFYYDGDTNGAGVWEKNLKLVTVDFTAVNVGDRVRLTGNDEVHEFVVNAPGPHAGFYSKPGHWWSASQHWTLEILERAKVNELPSEPGLYVDNLGDPWKLADNGYWYDKGYANNSSNRNMEYIQSRAPFVLLAPVTGNDDEGE